MSDLTIPKERREWIASWLSYGGPRGLRFLRSGTTDLRRLAWKYPVGSERCVALELAASEINAAAQELERRQERKAMSQMEQGECPKCGAMVLVHLEGDLAFHVTYDDPDDPGTVKKCEGCGLVPTRKEPYAGLRRPLQANPERSRP